MKVVVEPKKKKQTNFDLYVLFGIKYLKIVSVCITM